MNLHLGRVAVTIAALLPLAVPAAAQASYADHIRATPGLEWYLPLDETTGNDLVDVVSGRPLGVAGSRVALAQPGALDEPGNRAVRFLGGGSDAKSQSHVELGTDLTDAYGQRPYSFEAWVQVERTDGRSLRVYSDEDYMGGVLVAVRDGQLVFSRYDSGLRFVRGPDLMWGIHPTVPKRATTLSSPVTIGAWTHVVATYDGGRMRLFTDGVERASAPSTFDISNEGMIISGRAELGVRSELFFDGRFWLEFRGSVDEPALYRRALTSCEVADHHRAAITPPSSPTAETTICGDVPPS